jgi:hypothetical protein
MSGEDQWFTIFDILFPGHTPRPKSAYVNTEITVELERYQDFMDAEGPNLISGIISSRGIRVEALGNEERDLAELLRASVQDGLRILAQSWSASMMADPTAPISHVADGSLNSDVYRVVNPQLPSTSLTELLNEELSEEPVLYTRNGGNEDQAFERLTEQSWHPSDSDECEPQHSPTVQPGAVPVAEQAYMGIGYAPDTDDNVELWEEWQLYVQHEGIVPSEVCSAPEPLI